MQLCYLVLWLVRFVVNTQYNSGLLFHSIKRYIFVHFSAENRHDQYKINIKYFIYRDRTTNNGTPCAFHVYVATSNELMPWSRFLPEKLTVSQLFKKFSAFYETRRFITAFTRARHLSLSWVGSIVQSFSPIPRSCELFRNMLIFLRWVLCTSPNTQATGPPFVGCSRLFI